MLRSMRRHLSLQLLQLPIPLPHSCLQRLYLGVHSAGHRCGIQAGAHSAGQWQHRLCGGGWLGCRIRRRCYGS